MDRFQLLKCLWEHMDILLQTIISEFSIKAPKDPKHNSLLLIFTFFIQTPTYHTFLESLSLEEFIGMVFKISSQHQDEHNQDLD